MNRAPAAAVLSIVAVVAAVHPCGAANAVDECIQKARDKAIDALAKGATPYESRRQLEADIVACQNPAMNKDTAFFIGTINADLAQFGHQFLLGGLNGLAFRNARLDRARKLRELGKDVALHKAVRKGDADHDLIPDDRDRCPRTPAGIPTDDFGCPIEGETRPPMGDESDLRRLLAGVSVLVNEACNGAPEPLTSKPFRYGRSPTNFPLPAGSIKMVVAQVSGMPQGCDLFYEFHLHFMDPVDLNAPPTKDLSLVFGEGEDIEGDGQVAIFGLPVGQPLSPGRTAALDAFKIYQQLRWRVRTVIGGPVMSPWSATVTQPPVAGGIP